jgi:hypothetical protein
MATHRPGSLFFENEITSFFNTGNTESEIG